MSDIDIMAPALDLLSSGRRQLTVEAREWERMSTAIERVMRFA